MTRKNRARKIGIVMTAVLLFALSSCMMDGPPKFHKSNGQPYGKYVGEAGTLTFMEEGAVAPSGEDGYVIPELAPEYMYLLDGRENGEWYDFKLERREGDSDRRYWYIYDDVTFLDFIWDREGWNAEGDTVTIRSPDGDLVFKWIEGR